MKNIALLVLLLFALQACRKNNDDNQKPVITILSPGDDTITGGDSIHVRIDLSDNADLSQVKMELHSAFDGHSHKKKAGTIPMEWDSIFNLSGTFQHLELYIVVPADLMGGKYHLEVNALDKAGNEAEFAERELLLLNSSDSEAPEWSSLSISPVPDTNGTIFLSISSDTLVIAGTATDNMELEVVKLFIQDVSTHLVVVDADTPLAGKSAFYISRISFNGALSEHDVTLLLKDWKGNSVLKKMKLVLKP